MMRAQQPFAELDAAAFDRVISINLRGVFPCLKYALHEMVCAGKSAVVNTASAPGVIWRAIRSRSTGGSRFQSVRSTRLDELMASARAADSENAVEAEPHLETRTSTNRNSRGSTISLGA
jgi:NAD(P)-dependent dehydrogenase (short-subunit alcohol dehydrogenase family)